MEGVNVMIVDDSIIMIKNLTTMLKELGHNVVCTCKNGQTAVLGYGKHNPDIVTMDITMPDMNGIEATKKIVQTFPDAAIIMITSHGQEAMVLESIQAGAKGYILKPLNSEKLKEAIEKVLAKSKKISS